MHIGYHCGEVMSSTMVTALEPLNTASGAISGNNVFAFVPILALRSWKSFTFDREQRIELAVSATFNNKSGPAWFRGKINFSTAACFIDNLGSELHMIPNGRNVRGTIEVITEVFS